MKDYFVEFTDGYCDWFEAKTDNSAMNKAKKIARRECTDIEYLAECFEDDEIYRVIYKR